VHRKRLEEKLQQRNAELAELATTDGLTDLCSSRHLHETLATASSLAARTRCPLSVVMLDVDWFKLYNDDFGNLAVDVVLHQIGSILFDVETTRKLVESTGNITIKYGNSHVLLGRLLGFGMLRGTGPRFRDFASDHHPT